MNIEKDVFDLTMLVRNMNIHREKNFEELMKNLFSSEKNSEDLQKITEFLMSEFDEKDLSKILSVCGELYK